MREPRQFGEALVTHEVNRLIDAFEYPDELGGGIPSVGGGASGAPTIVVAASDSSDISKSKADFICPGVNDEGIINTAILACIQLTDGYAGRVVLCEGYYDIGAVSEILVRAGVSLQGLNHRGVHLLYSGSASQSAAVLEVQGGGAVRDLQIIDSGSLLSGNYGIDVSTGTGPAIIERVEMDHSGLGIILSPDQSAVVGCQLETSEGGIRVEGDWCDIDGNYISGFGPGIDVLAGTVDSLIRNNRINLATNGIELAGGNDRTLINGNLINDALEHGIALSTSDRCRIVDNIINHPGINTHDTFDGINIDGNRNLVEGNIIIPATSSPQPRYGINAVGGECNMIVGNDLSDKDDYGTDAIGDSAANTQLFYPNDATYGDNFTDCGTGS